MTRQRRSGRPDCAAVQGEISADSPAGKALLNAVPGDEVEVVAPTGSMKLVVEHVAG